ncbi:hypothetical protein Acr_09g0003720 [Actinidia rufa]|uniref:Oxidoreductase-like domain-containing protein n=1 Tax=Actinidia rufa TaxID=165716 RepID=A0A7J0F675_9ERIC|nr:hypothetical protein Acr_09g0003720 [Actinidia rufa]
METTPFGQRLRHVGLYTTLPPSANPQHQKQKNAIENSGFVMRDLTLRTITANRITIYSQSHRSRLFCAENTASKRPMADESKIAKPSPPPETEKIEAEKIPPPPEKPLRGDCCGSGCVRCVWDVYYEELEDYKKLFSESKSKSGSGSE